jgi:hypothetical protein
VLQLIYGVRVALKLSKDLQKMSTKTHTCMKIKKGVLSMERERERERERKREKAKERERTHLSSGTRECKQCGQPCRRKGGGVERRGGGRGW